MTTNKSIDGLSPRRRKKPASSTNPDGFSPIVQPRKTSYSAQKATKKSVTPPGDIRPEDYIPPRRTQKNPNTTKPSLEGTPVPKKSRSAINEEFLEPTRVFDFDEDTGELMTTKEIDEDTKKSQKTTKPTPRKKSSKTHKKWSKKRKIWTWIGIIFALLIIGGVIWFFIWGNDLLARLTGGQGNLMDLISETYEPLKTDENGRTNILAFGTSGFDMEGTSFEGTTHDGAELTDSIMLISFNQETGDAVLVSLPRDLKVDPICTYTGKINETYWCNNMEGNDEKAGAEALMEQVGDIFDVDIEYYAHVNWGSLKQIVDQIGGVTITLDEDIFDYDYTGAVYDAGVPYTINGDQAVGLARARHGTEHGDFSRGASQQKILIGIKDKILQDGLSIPDMLGLANILGDNLRTNFTVGELKSLAHLAETIDWSNIEQVSLLEPEPLLTDSMINGISYVFPTAGITDFSEIQAYIHSLLTPPSVESENPTVLVLNSTDRDGLASAEQANLESEGFTQITIDNLDEPYDAPYTLYTFTDSAPESQSVPRQQPHRLRLCSRHRWLDGRDEAA